MEKEESPPSSRARMPHNQEQGFNSYIQTDMKESYQRNKQEHCMMMWEIVAVASGLACMARGRLLQVGLLALRRLLQWSKQNVAAKRPLPRCPSFKRPVRALLFPPTCLRRMHLRLTILPSESALALLSLLIDFEIICC
jgi:hypothetical protein